MDPVPRVEPWSFRDDATYLLVILESKLILAFMSELPHRGFELSGISFRDLGLGNWVGFYDWLRRDVDNAIGVRIALLESLDEFLVAVETLPYIRRRGSIVEMYFGHSRDYKARISCDQAFEDNLVYQSDAGIYAMSFGMRWLTKEARASIARHRLYWE